jgi:hypothetical protein
MGRITPIGYQRPEGGAKPLKLYLPADLQRLFDDYRFEHRLRSANETGLALLRRALGMATQEPKEPTLEERIEQGYRPTELDPRDYATAELFEEAKKRWPDVPVYDPGERPAVKVHFKEDV